LIDFDFKIIFNINILSNEKIRKFYITSQHKLVKFPNAKPKKEEKYLFEPIQNLNALAGDTKIVDKIGQDRYSNTLKYKSKKALSLRKINSSN
jgi:hypothetical protein